jgi:hypothetical protein
MFKTSIKSGNATSPYREVHSQEFHSEFGARLFGFLYCNNADQYHYWMVQNPLGDTSGHLA